MNLQIQKRRELWIKVPMISLINAKNEAKPSLESLVILPLVGFDRSRGRGVSLTNKPGPLPLRVKHLPLPLLVEDASFRGQATESSGGKPSLPLPPPGVRSPRPYEAINGDLSPPSPCRPSFSRCTCNEMSSRYDQAYVSAQFHGNSSENTVIRDVRRCCSSCRASIPRSFLLVICDLQR